MKQVLHKQSWRCDVPFSVYRMGVRWDSAIFMQGTVNDIELFHNATFNAFRLKLSTLLLSQ